MKKCNLIFTGIIVLALSGCSSSHDLGTNKTEIIHMIEAANFCTQDSDCTVLEDLQCPFGCYKLVNKSTHTQLIREKIDSYEKQLVSEKCVYSCMEAPTTADLGCQQGKCIDRRQL